ncbi:Nucleoside diphosphate kinase family protein [Prunus dulcis]|uniref:Nucleoside diphosphate kinase family protein n=1 Tax=Prunus dulcis TaxID=3755 RepID=A0A4Y1R7T1_PRUDU|nr:Nucleoside diphosphate kinase family protein [Prunus dulcis]
MGRGDSAEISAESSRPLVSGPGIGVMSGIPKDSSRVLRKFGAGEYACLYVETLYKSGVARIVHAFEKLKEYLNMIIAHFTVKPESKRGCPK